MVVEDVRDRFDPYSRLSVNFSKPHISLQVQIHARSQWVFHLGIHSWRKQYFWHQDKRQQSRACGLGLGLGGLLRVNGCTTSGCAVDPSAELCASLITDYLAFLACAAPYRFRVHNSAYYQLPYPRESTISDANCTLGVVCNFSRFPKRKAHASTRFQLSCHPFVSQIAALPDAPGSTILTFSPRWTTSWPLPV